MRFLGAGGTDALGTATDQCMFLPKAQRADGHYWQSQLRTNNLVWHSRCDLRLIDKMVPQALTEWASQKLGVEPPGFPAGHPAADQLLHFVYSVTWGALAAPVLFATGRRRPAPKGDQRHRSPSLAPVGFNDQPIGWVIDPGVARGG